MGSCRARGDASLWCDRDDRLLMGREENLKEKREERVD